MADALDIRTLLAAAFVTHAVCLAALAVLRLKIRAIPGLPRFLLGQALSIVAIVLYWLVDPSDVPAAVAANAFSVAWMALTFDGIRRFYGLALRWPSWIVALVLLPCFAYWTVVRPDAEWRVLATIGPMAVLCFGTAWIAATRSATSERLLSALITVGFGAFGLALVGRMVSMSWNPWAVILDAGAPSTAATFLMSSLAMIAGTLGVAIVAHQRVVAELVEAREEAEAASRVKSEFLATMSHEIRTPMNGVMGGVTLLLAAELGERERRYARTIETSGRAMLGVLDDILDFAKCESRHMELEHRPFDLVGAIRATVDTFAEAATVRGLRLDLELDTAATSHPVVLGDAGRLRQVLSNLVTNALKFTESGGVTVRSTLRSTGNECAARFEVEDTGPGIGPEAREHLFEPFYQGDSSTTRRFGGTGLGLAICRDLVHLMEGSIGVEPGDGGEGSRFWFTASLPFADPDALDAADPGIAPTPRARPGRILVAEDNPVNQFVLVEMLGSLGHTPEIAEDGETAVDRALAESFDLVLMDCQMPGTDGLEATRRIRASAPNRSLPIIAVTAATLDENRDLCLEAGMDDFLDKPVEPDELARVLARWLPGRSLDHPA